MTNTGTAEAAITDESQSAIANTGTIREWIGSWTTVFCAELLSVVTACESLTLDLPMNR